MEIILGSNSPRRIEILKRYGLEFSLDSPKLESENMTGLYPEVVAMALAFEKGQDVLKRKRNGLIMSFDTIVVYREEIMGKPKDEKDAFETLKKLSGNTHQVITGICLTTGYKKILDYEITQVKFKEIDDKMILKYISTGEPMDKAGSYGIQGIGEIFVEEVKGSYSNVVGLPISKLDHMLRKEFDIDIL